MFGVQSYFLPAISQLARAHFATYANHRKSIVRVPSGYLAMNLESIGKVLAIYYLELYRVCLLLFPVDRY
jgi:hypothetical protein